jgi:hypothetical protein
MFSHHATHATPVACLQQSYHERLAISLDRASLSPRYILLRAISHRA